MKTILRSLALAGVCAVSAFAVPAAAFTPSERITLVSQSSPGTGNDLMLRKIAEIWMKNNMVDQPVGNENVTGAMGENARRFMVVENAGNEHVLFA